MKEDIREKIDRWFKGILKEQKAYGGYLPIGDGEFFVFKGIKEIDEENRYITVKGEYQDEEWGEQWKKAHIIISYPEDWSGEDEKTDVIDVEIIE